MQLADSEHLDEADQTEEQPTEGSDHGNEPEAESEPKLEAELELEAKVETEATDDTSSKHLSLTFLDSPIIFEEPEAKDHLEDQHPHRRRHHDNLVKLFFNPKLCLSSSFCPNSCMTLVVLYLSEGHV